MVQYSCNLIPLVAVYGLESLFVALNMTLNNLFP
jgi:hypothetical protein